MPTASKTPWPTESTDWIDATRTAALSGFTIRTLSTLRRRGEGPPEYRFTPRTIRYRESEVLEWIQSRRS
jgi:predicted DNA-binding transcriptional regulator AlpA